MATCRICLGSAFGSLDYHFECLESLFATKALPRLDIELSKLMGLAAEMAGKMSISGVQEKVSLRLLFSWRVSNGDQHLKNFSLLRTPEGRWRLAPAYDLICTRLAIPSDLDLALPICGKRSNLNRQSWLDFAEYSQIPERAAVRLLNEQIDALEPSLRRIEASFLPDELKSQYQEILRQTTDLLR